MNERDVEALARAALEDDKRATPGPWAFEAVPCNCGDCGPVAHVTANDHVVIDGHAYTSTPCDPSDGELIAAARSREPLLALEVLRLRAWLRYLAGDNYSHDEDWKMQKHAEAALSGEPAPIGIEALLKTWAPIVERAAEKAREAMAEALSVSPAPEPKP